MKKTLLIVGSGDIALRTAPLFKNHYRIFGLYRNSNNIGSLRSHGMTPIYGDLDLPQTLERISGIAQLVIHLAPPQSEGLRDNRTNHLLSALSRQPRNTATILPQRLIYISTSGVYGDCQGAMIDETHSVNPTNERAIRRVDAEKKSAHGGHAITSPYRFCAYRAFMPQIGCRFCVCNKTYRHYRKTKTAIPIISMPTIWRESFTPPHNMANRVGCIMRAMTRNSKWALISIWSRIILAIPARRGSTVMRPKNGSHRA